MAVSRGVGCRHGSDPTLLRLWCGSTATAPIGPLAWEPPHATSVALKSKKKKKGELNKKHNYWNPNRLGNIN